MKKSKKRSHSKTKAKCFIFSQRIVSFSTYYCSKMWFDFMQTHERTHTHSQVIIPFCNASHKINMMRYSSCAKSIILFAIRTPFIYSVWSFWSLTTFPLSVCRSPRIGLFSEYLKLLWRANDAIFNQMHCIHRIDAGKEKNSFRISWINLRRPFSFSVCARDELHLPFCIRCVLFMFHSRQICQRIDDGCR